MFDASLYALHRPLYPSALFESLIRGLRGTSLVRDARMVDLGCGAGQSARSWLECGLESSLVLVDPDPKMLAQARMLLGSSNRIEAFVQASADSTGLESASFDAVMIGSALHWMDVPAVARETARLVRPGGRLLVFEYQFPKAPSLPALNEWVRRGFNLAWKAPGQLPRGSLRELVAPIAAHPNWRLVEGKRVPMALELGPKELSGLLFSQSRYLHFERTLPLEAVQAHRDAVSSEIGRMFGGEGGAGFDFGLRSFLFSNYG